MDNKEKIEFKIFGGDKAGADYSEEEKTIRAMMKYRFAMVDISAPKGCYADEYRVYYKDDSGDWHGLIQTHDEKEAIQEARKLGYIHKDNQNGRE